MTANSWIILREPGCIPQLKGPWPATMMTKVLREFMSARPAALLTVLSIADGHPLVTDGPEELQILDGRSASTARRHRRSTRLAWANADWKAP